jgi:hypothetical protein
MKPEQASYIDRKLVDLQGQVVGLACIIANILSSNPQITIDEKAVGKLILETRIEGGLDHPDVQIKARATMHSILSKKTGWSQIATLPTAGTAWHSCRLPGNRQWITQQSTETMTESEYKELSEFQHLPLYDDDDPRCPSVDRPDQQDPESAIWLTALSEATDLKTARDYLQNGKLTPKGGIRYWDGKRKESTIFAYFWKKK